MDRVTDPNGPAIGAVVVGAFEHRSHASLQGPRDEERQRSTLFLVRKNFEAQVPHQGFALTLDLGVEAAIRRAAVLNGRKKSAPGILRAKPQPTLFFRRQVAIDLFGLGSALGPRPILVDVLVQSFDPLERYNPWANLGEL